MPEEEQKTKTIKNKKAKMVWNILWNILAVALTNLSMSIFIFVMLHLTPYI